jgi:hypothetical protein
MYQGSLRSRNDNLSDINHHSAESCEIEHQDLSIHMNSLRRRLLTLPRPLIRYNQ